MKKIILLATAILFLASCSKTGTATAKDNASATNNTEETSQVQIHTIKITKAEVLKKIFDYENKDNKEWKYLGDKPAIIDFYADWCPPCRKIAPSLEELAKQYQGEIYIYKVDVDAEKDVAAAFGITNLPTLLFVPMQGQPSISMGLISKEDLDNAIQTTLLKK